MKANSERSREILNRERNRIVGLKTSLGVPATSVSATADALAEKSSATEDPADQGCEAFERAKDLSILVSLQSQLQDLDRALERLERGQYGVCEACGKGIGEARLEALPAARFCLPDQAAAERLSA